MIEKKEGIQRVMIDGQEVALKHDFLGWRIIRPFRNMDGSINWKNVISGGSWIKLAVVTIVVGILLGAMFEYYSQLLLLNKCLAALNDSVILFP